ncbi:nucleoside hydrolase [Metabacillus indicus]|uniref:nucleoside hydrolase n=1 Tax=Metabacillus indicus TaxID=246786 RepID=UPI00317B9D59
MRKLLLFADPGIDDSLAIIYALLHPDIDVLGVVTSFGNVSKQQATENTAYLLELAGREDIPVIEGATFPLSGELSVYYPEIHGAEGLGPIRPPKGVRVNLKRFSHVFELIEKHPDLTIADIGRPTSLAHAFNLNLERLQKVTDIYSMGGAFFVPGNVTALAEANYHGDPVAANVVLQYAKSVHIAPLNVTDRAIVTREAAAHIESISKNPFKDLIPAVTNYYAAAYAKLRPHQNGPSIHDAFALYYMMNQEKIYSVKKTVSVCVLGDARGMSFTDFRNHLTPPGAKHTIALNFNYQDFLTDFIKVMSSEIS